ncbi:hypothetical protein ACIRP2_28380 [Streptomyces sp. NPDC101194]|uniref:hypothetical protein n=1 Tax=Streptomyces sp. NPDC101194 TaxID=3366127 RepID=UPI00380B1B5B
MNVDTRTTNTLTRHARAQGERVAAELTVHGRTLKHVTLNLNRIGGIARVALVLDTQ